MEQNPCWKLIVFDLVKKFILFHGTSNVHYRVHKSPLLYHVLNQLKPSLRPFSLRPILLYLIFLSNIFIVEDLSLVCIPRLTCAYYMSYPPPPCPTPGLPGEHNNIW
jgi:hypothetical protein